MIISDPQGIAEATWRLLDSPKGREYHDKQRLLEWAALTLDLLMREKRREWLVTVSASMPTTFSTDEPRMRTLGAKMFFDEVEAGVRFEHALGELLVFVCGNYAEDDAVARLHRYLPMTADEIAVRKHVEEHTGDPGPIGFLKAVWNKASHQ